MFSAGGIPSPVPPVPSVFEKVPMTAIHTNPPRLERRYARLGLLLIAPTLIVFTLVIVYPLLAAIYLSFSDPLGRLCGSR